MALQFSRLVQILQLGGVTAPIAPTIAFVQKSAQNFGDGEVNKTFTLTGTTAGNLLVLTTGNACGSSNNSASVMSTPAGWNVGVADAGATNTGSAYLPSAAIFWKIAAGGTETAAFTLPADSYVEGTISEFSKSSGTWALDTVASSATSGVAGRSASVGPATNSGAPALCVVMGHGGAGDAYAANFTDPQTGFTVIDAEHTAAVHIAYSSGYKLLTGTGAQSASWTWTDGGGFAGALVNFVVSV